MANIWKQNRDVTQDVKRNNFDLSFQSHATFKFGYLYPVFSRRVVPGDSFRIDSVFDLKMMPVAFPVQSRVRAHMHFFYVRNKNLWKNWEDWISGLKSNDQCPHPYINVSDKDVSTGSIHDFLGLPTSVVTKSSVTPVLSIANPSDTPDSNLKKVLFRSSLAEGLFGEKCSSTMCIPFIFFDSFNYPLSSTTVLFSDGVSDAMNTIIEVLGTDYSFGSVTNAHIFAFTDLNFDNGTFKNVASYSVPVDSDFTSVLIDNNFKNAVNQSVSSGNSVYLALSLTFATFNADVSMDVDTYGNPMYASPTIISSSGHYDWSTLNIPFYSNNIVPINALKYRAYESIYRAYYASDVWQPLVIDGQKEYNKFITNNNDGADPTNYHLFKRNYELDFLTSALPSPQAGPAPLVGISALGDVTIEDENGITTGHADVDSNGTITKISITSPLASVDHARTAANIAMLGMNINDFRSANSLQRLLEQTLRSGYRYVNFVKGHFGATPKYDVLDMAQFIGGYSRDVEISTVISQSDTAGLAPDAGKNLGDYGGYGRVVGGSNHSVTHYCDDYGYIMGIMCITPTPAYSQLLPKEDICPTNYLDYFFPEMSSVGMQPVPFTEVTPLQAYLDELEDPSKKITDTFGYQRPNYDMVGSVDEVHGLFRTDLKDMLINRIFDGRPELGSSFLEIDPDEVNDIFINQNDDDKFIGHLAFKVNCKRPLPRVHIPGIK